MSWLSADEAYAKYGEGAWNLQSDESGNRLEPKYNANNLDPNSDRWIQNATGNDGYYHPMDGGIYHSYSGDQNIINKLRELYPHAKQATAAQLKALDTPDKGFGGLFDTIEKFGDSMGPLLPFLPIMAGMMFPGAGAGSGAFGFDPGLFNAGAGGAGALTAEGAALTGAGAASTGGGMDFDLDLNGLEDIGDYANGSMDGWWEGAQNLGSELPAVDDWSKWGEQFGKLGADGTYTFPNAGNGSFLDSLKNLPSGVRQAAQAALKAVMGGDEGALSALAKLGIPAALLAGLFEKNNNPMIGKTMDFADIALDRTRAFGNLDTIPLTPTQKRAIKLANENVGAWQPDMYKAGALTDEAAALARANVGAGKPYLEEGAAFTRAGAAGLPSVNLSQYLNPYMAAVKAPVNREYAQQQITDNANAMKVGAFGGSRTGVREAANNRNRIESLAKVDAAAFDNATTLAQKDLAAKTAAGGAFNTMAGTASSLGNADVARLGTTANQYVTNAGKTGAFGEADVTNLTTAGALERKPAEEDRAKMLDTAKVAISAIPGTSSAITTTGQPSTLSQITGAFGALNSMNKLGLAP